MTSSFPAANPTWSGYEGEAGLALARAYEAVPSQDMHGPIRDLLPASSAPILDVGAGSGRDAAWLAGMGHQVLAVEPSPTLRAEGARLHPDPRIRWMSDHLPDLSAVRTLHASWRVILLSAVWQHVAPQDRQDAFRALTGLLSPGGLLLISLRLGPPDETRGMYPVSLAEVRELGALTGLAVAREAPLPDLMGRSGISWITVALTL